MRAALVLLSLLLASLAASQSIDYAQLLREEEGEHKQLFEAFRQQYNKSYINVQEEYLALQAFKKNIFHMYRHKAFDPNGRYAVTKFMDLTPQDFQERYLKPLPEIDQWMIPQQKGGPAMKLGLIDWLTGSEDDSLRTDDLPIEFDWREKNIVTEAKQQSTCGSCWAFATTGVIEAQYALKYGKLIDFSEQQLIDCDPINKGCNGGLMTDAYRYLEESPLQSAKSYGEYENSQDRCHANPDKGKAFVSHYYQIQRDERAIQRELVKNGPVAVGINGRFLQFFDGGVLNPAQCDASLNHAVLIVGYGVTSDGVPFWTIKNQWGPDWGDEGYFKLIRGEKRCGVNTYASIAFIE